MVVKLIFLIPDRHILRIHMIVTFAALLINIVENQVVLMVYHFMKLFSMIRIHLGILLSLCMS